MQEEGSATSHAGIELLEEKFHARNLTDLGEKVQSQIDGAGDKLDGECSAFFFAPDLQRPAYAQLADVAGAPPGASR